MTVYTIDTETHLITPGRLAPRVVCLQVKKNHDPVKIFARDHGLTAAWRGILDHCLSDPATVVVGANVAFDMAVLAEYTGTLRDVLSLYHRGQVRCIHVRERLLRIARDGDSHSRVSLANMVRSHLGRVIDDEKKAPPGVLDAVLAGDMTRLEELPARYRYAQLDGLSVDQWPAEFVTYAADDVLFTHDVWRAQGPMCLTNEREQVRAAFALHLFACWGVRTDAEAVAEAEKKLQAEHDRYEKTLIKFGVIEEKKRKDTAAARAFVECFHPDPPRTKTGRLSTSTQVLATALEASPHADLVAAGVYQVDKKKNMNGVRALIKKVLGPTAPRTEKGGISASRDTLSAALATALEAGLSDEAEIFSALVNISKPAKFLTTYIPVLWSGTRAPINPRYSVLKATGRTSCSNPNLQNLPRKGGLRECFVPRPGNVFIQADWSAAEMVSLAWLNDKWGHGSTMKNAINSGQDLHTLLASELIGLPYDECLSMLQAEGERGGPMTDARQFAKVGNFGFPGGMGAESFCDYANAWGIACTPERAQQLKQKFTETWPEMRAYFAKAAAAVGDSVGEIIQEHSGRVRGGASYTQACNTWFQGLTADVAKAAAWNIALACYMSTGGPLYGWRPWAFVHDEFILEGPADCAEQALDELIRIMVGTAKKILPGIVHQADGKIMARWQK